MFSLDILLKIIGLALVTVLSAWYINQLPSINTKPIPGRSACLILLGIGIVFSTALLGYSLPENPTQEQLQTFELINDLKNPAIFITLGTLVYLVIAYAVIPEPVKESESKSQDTVVSDTAQEWRYKLLNVIKADIAERFADTLHESELIKLIADEQPDKVGRLPKQEIKTPNSLWENIKQKIPIFRQVRGETEEGLSIIEIFNQDDINGRLLILGEPGAGKTTSLLELAYGLVQTAVNDRTQPFPFIFELSDWQDDQKTIAEWIQDYLKDSNNVPADVTQTWLETGLLLPLFDGLDELGLARQKLCISRLNDFLAERKAFPAVVCCRKEEYLAGEVLLDGLRGAICLQPLNDQQIQTYLKKINCLHLWQGLKNDPDGLLELARIPLFLNIIPVAYPEGIKKTQSVNTNTSESDHLKKIRHDLFANYVNRQLRKTNHQKKSSKFQYTLDETKHYLKWLAQRLIERQQTEFLLEKMQPDLLGSEKTQNLYKLISGFMAGIVFGIIGGIILAVALWFSGTISWLILGLIVGTIFGIIGGVILGLFQVLAHTKILPSEAIQVSPKKVKKPLILGIIIGLIWGGFLTLNWGIIEGVIVGLILGLIMGIAIWLSSGKIKTRNKPNQGIIESAKNTFIISILSFPLSFLLFVYMQSILGRTWTWYEVLLFSLGLSFTCGFSQAGIPVIQHYILRFFLWRERSIPFFYADFLNYAHDKKLLKRVGGRYRFFHDLLREYFAEM